MKRRLLKLSSIAAVIAFLSVFYGLAIYNTPESDAIKATDFNPGRIIDDAVFYNADTMTVEEIQKFMDDNLPTCDMWGTGSSAGRIVNETGYVMPAGSTNADYARKRREAGNTRYHEPPYVCLNKYYENPETHETLYETNGVVKEGMISAAQIIYNEAHNYNINPQVLLVLIKKESYVWGDTWPLKWEYNAVTGYGCPDNAPCDTSYYGFYNQVHMAAFQFNRYKEHNYEYNYHPGMVNNIYYSPTYSCGTKQVYIENMATASLYIYTPYVPNDAALANYPGTSYCGSYGNRNFFMYFNEWFGSTYATLDWIKLETPRYLTTVEGASSINMLYQASSTELPPETTQYYTSKIIGPDHNWCLRSEENERNGNNRCVSFSFLKETEWSWQDMETPRLMEAQSNAEVINPTTRQTSEVKLEKYNFFDQKMFFPSGKMCLHIKGDETMSCVLYESLSDIAIDIYPMERPRKMENAAQVEIKDIIYGVSSNLPAGNIIEYNKKILPLDADEWCLIPTDASSTYSCVPLGSLRNIWEDMEYPRSMIVNKDTHKINPYDSTSDELFLPKGLSRRFTKKTLMSSGEWCLQTEYDAERATNYCIIDNQLSEYSR